MAGDEGDLAGQRLRDLWPIRERPAHRLARLRARVRVRQRDPLGVHDHGAGASLRFVRPDHVVEARRLAGFELVLDEVADGEGIALELRRQLRRPLFLVGDGQRHLQRDQDHDRHGHERGDDA